MGTTNECRTLVRRTNHKKQIHTYTHTRYLERENQIAWTRKTNKREEGELICMNEKNRCVKKKQHAWREKNMSEEEKSTLREGEECNSNVREGEVATCVRENMQRVWARKCNARERKCSAWGKHATWVMHEGTCMCDPHVGVTMHPILSHTRTWTWHTPHTPQRNTQRPQGQLQTHQMQCGHQQHVWRNAVNNNTKGVFACGEPTCLQMTNRVIENVEWRLRRITSLCGLRVNFARARENVSTDHRSRIFHQRSSIEDPPSRIFHRRSSIEDLPSRILDRGLSIEDLPSRIVHLAHVKYLWYLCKSCHTSVIHMYN